MSPERVSVRSAVAIERTARALGKFIFVCSALGILFAGLFPFDFHFPRHGLRQEIARKFDSSPEPATLQDRVQNFLFFVPFGFGVGATIRMRDRKVRTVAAIAVGLVAGGILSLSMETLQVFLGFRDPTWLDVLMNTTGSVAGAVVGVFAGDPLLDSLAGSLSRVSRFLTFGNVTTVLAGYTILQLLLPLATMGRGQLKDWDHSLPLLVGNETTGDRGWAGTIWRVDLASRAATPDEVKRMFDGATAHDVFGPFQSGSYDLLGTGPYPDQSDTLSPLTWVGEQPDPLAAPAAPTSQPAEITPHRWLRTSAGAARAVHRIRQTSEFTVSTIIAPAVEDQRGPARIVSISDGHRGRNLSLMHDYHQLSLRLRTPLTGPDGSAPEAIVDDVFDSTGKKHIVITYKDAVMIAYVDGVERARMEITPEAALIWRLYPRPIWKVKLSRYGFRSYAAVYRLLVFIPFSALLVAAGVLSRRPRHTQILVMAGATLVTAVVLELILGSLTVSGFQFRNLLLSLLIAFGTIAALYPWRGRTVSMC